MKAIRACACLLVLLTSALADDARVRELIRQLDDDDPAAREAAVEALSALGKEAVPLLEQAVKEGSPEAQMRAGQALRQIRAREVLERKEAVELKSRWEAVTGGDARARRKAIKEWVAACGKTAGTVEALLDLVRADPTGVAGGAACEAMNWLCAPRTTAARESLGSGRAWSGTMPAKEYFQWMLEDKLVLSEGGAGKVAGIGLTEKNQATTGSDLDQLRWACALAGVTYRMDDESGAVHVELPEESLEAWEPWWKSVRDDRVALMDLGLLEIPDGARLEAKALEEWVKELSSKDPRHARVARTVLRTVSADQIDAIRKRAAGPALQGIDRRLALRKLGRVYFYREGADEGDYLMNLDGTGVRKVSGSLPLYYSGTPCAGGTVSYVPVLEGKDEGLWVLDLVGNAPPRRLSKLAGAIFCPEDGAHIALRDDAGALWLIDSATGKEKKLAAKDGTYFYWSPDGKMLGWTFREKEGIHLLDIAQGTVREYPDCVPYLEFMVWHPDSTRWACRRRLDYPVPPAGGKTTSRIEVTDVATGKTTAVTDNLPTAGLGWPAWSPDGLTMAAGWLDRAKGGDKGLAKVLLHDLKSGKTRELSHPVSCAPDTGAESRLTWISPGLVVWQDFAVERGWTCDVEKGTWAVHDKPTYSAQTVAGEWTLDEIDGDVVIVHNGDGTRFNLTESAAREDRVRALPPLK